MTGGGTADTEAPKKPALIIGAWPEDQPATETLRKAQDILRQLDVLLDFSEMFVPGLKRGYAIVPIPQRWGETKDQRQEIVQNTLQKVRRANVMLGVNQQGGTKSCGCPCRNRQRGEGRQDWRARSSGPCLRWAPWKLNSPRGPSGTTRSDSAAPPWRCQNRRTAGGQDGSSWKRWHRRWARPRRSRQPGSLARRSCAETTRHRRGCFTDLGGPPTHMGVVSWNLGGLTRSWSSPRTSRGTPFSVEFRYCCCKK